MEDYLPISAYAAAAARDSADLDCSSTTTSPELANFVVGGNNNLLTAGVSIEGQVGSVVDFDGSSIVNDSILEAAGHQVRWQWRQLPPAALDNIQLQGNQLRELRHQNQQLLEKLQAARSHSRQLETALGQRNEELWKLRQELLLREFWCRQVEEEAEQEAARSDWLLKRCQELQDRLAAAATAAGTAPPKAAHSPRLGRYSSASNSWLASAAPQPLPLPPLSPPPPLSQSSARPACKRQSVSATARQLLTGRCSFRLRRKSQQQLLHQPESASSVGGTSSSSSSLATTGASNSGVIRQETVI